MQFLLIQRPMNLKKQLIPPPAPPFSTQGTQYTNVEQGQAKRTAAIAHLENPTDQMLQVTLLWDGKYLCIRSWFWSLGVYSQSVAIHRLWFHPL